MAIKNIPPVLRLVVFLLLGCFGISSAATKAYWRLEGVLGTTVPTDGTAANPVFDDTVIDSSGNGNHMRTWRSDTTPTYIASSTPTVPQTGAANTSALEFHYPRDIYSQNKAIGSADLTAGFTVEAFIRANSRRWQVFVGKDGKPTAHDESPFWFKQRYDNERLEVNMLDTSGATIGISSNNPVVYGEWYHLAAVNNGSTLAFYIKGPGDSEYVLQGTKSTTGGMINSVANWSIGRGNWAGSNTDYVDGAVDEVRISDTPLNLSQFLFHDPNPINPSVSNIRATQRHGTKLVDVFYDLSGGTSAAYVSLQISSNGGTSFVVPATTLTGDQGYDIQPGRNKCIVWNAGTDWNNQISTTMCFRVTASDTPPAPIGFALIPAGAFQMGDSSGVGVLNELPVHSVYVSSFYMAKYEVTKGLWDEVRAWGTNNGYTDLAVGSFWGTTNYSKDSTHPVHMVDWYSMLKWCNARSQKEGLVPCYTVSGATYKTGAGTPDCNWTANGYRLPTEAEWEKAARGGLGTQNFPWGNNISHGNANYYSASVYYYDTSTTAGYHPAYKVGSMPYTAPVGSFPANGFGLCELAGNVYESCWDKVDLYGWSTRQDYPIEPSSDPRGPDFGSYRALRGGCFSSQCGPSGCRVSARNASDPSVGYDSTIGFRLARSL